MTASTMAHAKTKPKPEPRPKRLLLVAAAILVVAGAAFGARALLVHPASPDALAAIAKRHTEAFPIPPIKGTLDPKSPYRAGIEAYRRGDFRMAAQKFWILSSEASHWPGLHFYRGLSLLNSGDPRGAAAAFQEHLRLNPRARPARWYLALSLLASGREKDAKQQLETLAAGPETDYQEKARMVLAELR